MNHLQLNVYTAQTKCSIDTLAVVPSSATFKLNRLMRTLKYVHVHFQWKWLSGPSIINCAIGVLTHAQARARAHIKMSYVFFTVNFALHAMEFQFFNQLNTNPSTITLLSFYLNMNREKEKKSDAFQCEKYRLANLKYAVLSLFNPIGKLNCNSPTIPTMMLMAIINHRHINLLCDPDVRLWFKPHFTILFNIHIIDCCHAKISSYFTPIILFARGGNCWAGMCVCVYFSSRNAAHFQNSYALSKIIL